MKVILFRAYAARSPIGTTDGETVTSSDGRQEKRALDMA